MARCRASGRAARHEIKAGSSGRGQRLEAHGRPRPARAAYLECLAFRLDTDEGSLCYSGDSGLCDTIVELARGCDILIHMNHYFSGTAPTPAFRAACGNHETTP